MSAPRRAVYPGSFNPPTVAHLAIAQFVVAHCNVESVTFAVSQVALAKESVERPAFDDRIDVLRRSVEPHADLRVAVTTDQLLADIADGFDLVVMGADKWHQIQDPVFYNNDPAARDAALARLPEVALLPRPPFEIPPGVSALALDPTVAEQLAGVSSTLARNGEFELMTAEAQAFDKQTGAWTAPERYERYRSARD